MNHIVPAFIDVFAGAGGLSLGLMKAGWKGLFAVEKSEMAFETLKFNLIENENGPKFNWPAWLKHEAISVERFIEICQEHIDELKGISLLAGGPPCQGFSYAGRRIATDERNRLFERYLDVVRLLQPKMLLIENVLGFATPFRQMVDADNDGLIEEVIFNAAEELQDKLNELNYTTFYPENFKLFAKDFGVPQIRPRYFVCAISKSFLGDRKPVNPFHVLFKEIRTIFLKNYNLSPDREITVSQAISDLIKSHGFEFRCEPRPFQFAFGKYGDIDSLYQDLMRKKFDGEIISNGLFADSHRFPNHRTKTVQRFEWLMQNCRPGINLQEAERERLRQFREDMKTGKRGLAVLAHNEASHTLTSLPDDLIHYHEPRILTVREYARIQSFPDWFEFKSNYTTGSKNRRTEIPRYTQVANAVPPLLAEAVGKALLRVHRILVDRQQRHIYCKFPTEDEVLYIKDTNTTRCAHISKVEGVP